jgi:hypothetical protein
VFDNLQILAKLKFVKKPAAKFVKPAMFFWWLAIVFNLVQNIKKLLKLKKQFCAIQSVISKEPEKKTEFDSKIKALRAAKGVAIRNIIKCLGDLLPSSSGWGLTDNLGIKLSDSHIGIGGFVSALLVCWEVFPAAK